MHAVLLRFLLGAMICAAASPARADESTRRLQEELRRRHLYFGDIDGQLTEETAKALRQYQARKGLTPSGAADDGTLATLGLQGDGSARAPVTPLPDIPVLKSDLARAQNAADRAFLEKLDAEEKALASAEAPEPDAEIPATPPPPVAAGPEAALAAAEQFIREYLAAAQAEDPARELDFYGAQLDYFDHGVVTQQFVEKDVRRYYQRWPERKFTLLEVRASAGRTPEEALVKFRIRFDLKSPRESAAGQTDNTFRVRRTPDGLKLIGMRERRVRT